MNPTTTTTEKGRLAENRALVFLESAGLVLLARNYRTRRGEIDLVMRDRETTVFVEVRARSSNRVLHAAETIDRGKQNRIIRTSQHYLQYSGNISTPYYRYDVVCINGPLEKANIEWIKNAFDA